MIKPVQIKKAFLSLTATLFLSSGILVSCNNTAQKAESMQNSTSDTIKSPAATDSLNYIKDVNAFRKRIADTVAANDKTIAELLVKIKHDRSEAKVDYKKEAERLEQENKKLKKKMDEYAAGGKEKWDAFKADCSGDMDTISKQIKDFRISISITK